MRLLFSVVFTVITIFSWAQNCNFSVTASPDTNFCDNITVQLQSNITGTLPSNASYLWSPTTGLNNPNSPNPVATVSNTTNYAVTVSSVGTTNLITNGDFESGNTGFTTSYNVGQGGTWGPVSSAGTYLVTTSPNIAHSNFAACNDHTPGPGTNMMVINGATTPNLEFWCQTITVTPNTTYNFEMWATSAVTGNPAVLQVRFNGALPTSNLNLSTTTCNWQQYTSSWNSGSATSVTICVRTLILLNGGNDFAIDDIALYEVCERTSDVTLTNVTPNMTELEEELCVGDSIFAGGAYQYTDGIYTDVFTSFYGCDSIVVTDVSFQTVTKPDLGTDTTLCGDTPFTIVSDIDEGILNWSTGSSDTAITVNTAGTYILTISDNLGCSQSDTIEVAYDEYPVVNLGNDTMLCSNESITLDGTQSLSEVDYLWQDGSTASSYTVNNPGGVYSLTITNGQCEASDDVVVDFETCACYVTMPNLFSPNADGRNDDIRPLMSDGCEFTRYSYQIFNRWGNLVFTSSDFNERWDGRVSGELLPQDSYIWVLDYELAPRFEQEPVRETGTMLLVR